MTEDFPAWKPEEVEADEVGFDVPEVDWDEMDPTDLERLFDILSAAAADATLDGQGLDRLLSVLESVMFSPTPLDTGEMERLFSVLENAVVDPANPEHAEEALAILEASITGPDDPEAVDHDSVFSVLEASLVDPTDPGSAVEDLFSVVESIRTGMTSPDPDAVEDSTESFMSLFDVTGLGTTSGGLDDAADDIDSLLDSLGVGLSLSESTGEVDTFLETVDAEFRPDGESPDMSDEVRVARIVAAATQRTTEYSVQSGVRMGTRMVQAMMTAGSIAEFVEESQAIADAELGQLGISEGGDDRDGDGTASLSGKRRAADEESAIESLRERGAALLERSADVERTENVHPAFPRILDHLSPDEARILRLLATEGPQPSVDVRDVGYVPLTSQLVAAGVSMIGPEAGCRYESRVSAYLNNLQRLGLIWFSDEPVDNLKRYQVLEAQPAVQDALEDTTRPKMIRRSVHLTPFGADFCRVCLPIEVEAENAAGVYDIPEELEETAPETVGPESLNRSDPDDDGTPAEQADGRPFQDELEEATDGDVTPETETVDFEVGDGGLTGRPSPEDEE